MIFNFAMENSPQAPSQIDLPYIKQPNYTKNIYKRNAWPKIYEQFLIADTVKMS